MLTQSYQGLQLYMYIYTVYSVITLNQKLSLKAELGNFWTASIYSLSLESDKRVVVL